MTFRPSTGGELSAGKLALPEPEVQLPLPLALVELFLLRPVELEAVDAVELLKTMDSGPNES